MPTNRTPINRKGKLQITDKAVELFREMEDIDCTCEPVDWDRYWEHRLCAGCERWWELNSLLHHELDLKCWDWPAYENPNAANPFPEGSPAALRWKPDIEGQARYRALEAAADVAEIVG